MEDSEVGELWRRTLDHLTWPKPLAIEHDIVGLIHKLVEERARRYNFKSHLVSYHQAMSDFNIDPLTWRE